MHKIPRGSSENVQNPRKNFQNIYNPTRNFKKCTKFNEEHPKMHKITGDASKYAQNPTMIFRKCKKSHD
jgi:hypothetical protein